MQPAAFKAVAVVKFITELTQPSLERDCIVRVVVSCEGGSSSWEAKVHVQGSFFSKGWPTEDIVVVRSDGATLPCLKTEIQKWLWSPVL